MHGNDISIHENKKCPSKIFNDLNLMHENLGGKIFIFINEIFLPMIHIFSNICIKNKLAPGEARTHNLRMPRPAIWRRGRY